jgi:hypothetical protein
MSILSSQLFSRVENNPGILGVRLLMDSILSYLYYRYKKSYQ